MQTIAPPNTSNLLLVDDDETIRQLLTRAATDYGWEPVSAASGHEALALVHDGIEAVVLDYAMPGMDGQQTLILLRERYPQLPVIMLTGLNDAETAVRMLRAGASEYMTKPFELKRLFDVLASARRMSKTPAVPQLATSSQRAVCLESKSPQMLELYRQMEKAATLNSAVLLTGESGTGKIYFAREIHRMSARRDWPFVALNCVALPRELLESELFGQQEGTFTRNPLARAGCFEQASAGTVFLDEIGGVPKEVQPKLLNVLQDGEFFRVGGSSVVTSNARVIAATHVDLSARVETGEFREDLYYQLNIVELTIPALRDRIGDLPAIASSVLSHIAEARGVEGWTLSKSALELLQAYTWPGNIRQLENILQRTTASTDSTVLQPDDLHPLLNTKGGMTVGKSHTLQEIERDAFINAFTRNGKKKALTARELGISERSVYNLLARYKLK
jgi:two-component system nitrogen regulation response regulator GlnG